MCPHGSLSADLPDVNRQVRETSLRLAGRWQFNNMILFGVDLGV